jgi:GT2 family glycosyltransferase
MTLVSIVTPSYNQSQFLEKTILSVLEQNDCDIEYFVVDGGSGDGSLDIIKRYAHRLTWWVSEKDSGQAEAINKGAARAHGEIIAWLNSDDAYLPGAVRSAVEAFQLNPGITMIYGDMLAVEEHGVVINSLHYHPLTLEDLLCFQIIGQPAVFMRRNALIKAGGLDPTLHCLLDHQLWIKLAAQGEILHVAQTWAAARYHLQAKNRARAAEFGREAFRILDWASHEPGLATVLARVARRARASAYRLDARYLVDGGQPRAALKAWMHALVIHPPTALARLNLLGSALLELVGLGSVRQAVLRRRQKHYSF